MTSTARSDMRLASSWIVIASGSTISRAIFSFVLSAVAFQPLRAAAKRRDRTRALLFARSRAGDGQASAVALLAGARRPRRRHDDLLPRQAKRGTPAQPCAPPLPRRRRPGGFGDRGGRSDDRGRLGRRARDRRRKGRFAAGQPPSRLFLRLALEIGFLGAAQFFVALARFRGFAFEPFARLALTAGFGFRLLAAPIFLFASARVERARDCARSRCSSVKVCSTTPVFGGGGAAGLPAAAEPVSAAPATMAPARQRRAARRRARRARLRARRLARRQNATLHFLDDDRLAAPVRETLTHRSRSTGRLRCNVAFGGEAPRLLSPLLFVSLMRSSITAWLLSQFSARQASGALGGAQPLWSIVASSSPGPISAQTRRPWRETPNSPRPG